QHADSVVGTLSAIRLLLNVPLTGRPIVRAARSFWLATKKPSPGPSNGVQCRSHARLVPSWAWYGRHPSLWHRSYRCPHLGRADAPLAAAAACGAGWPAAAAPWTAIALTAGGPLISSITFWIDVKNTGTKNTARTVDVIMPPNTAVPSACRLAAPAPVAHTS